MERQYHSPLDPTLLTAILAPPTLQDLDDTVVNKQLSKFASYKTTNQMRQISNIYFVINSTCFGHLLCPSSGVIYCTLGNWTGPGSVVGIATAYGLDGSGVEFRWGRDFPHLSRPALRPPSLLYNGYRVLPGGKVQQGRDADPSPPSSAEVKNRVELYLYSPS